MTDSDWGLIDYFSKDEAWGDPEKMDFPFVQELSKFRDFIKHPIIIVSGTQGIHARNSLHYDGRAVDCIIPRLTLFDAWIAANRFSFTGIGFYPDWEYNAVKPGGLHLEMCPTNPIKRFWMGLGHGTPRYISMTLENIKLYYDDHH